MQIEPTKLNPITPGGVQRLAPTRPEASPSVTPTSAPAETEQVILSQRATEVQAAHQSLAATPEVRADLVARLKSQVADGSYKIDPDRIAEKIVPE
jgi:negative regulator of flagellin synthesis FlgM